MNSSEGQVGEKRNLILTDWLWRRSSDAAAWLTRISHETMDPGEPSVVKVVLR